MDRSWRASGDACGGRSQAKSMKTQLCIDVLREAAGMGHGRVGEREELHEDEACDAVLVETVPAAVHEEGSRKGLEAMASAVDVANSS